MRASKLDYTQRQRQAVTRNEKIMRSQPFNRFDGMSLPASCLPKHKDCVGMTCFCRFYQAHCSIFVNMFVRDFVIENVIKCKTQVMNHWCAEICLEKAVVEDDLGR
mmetsp:Transcript_79433/g.161576  ORF Transcript_79433/g.161576 Transcript_79433/m.161576 type:complete len:106 (-) Transcript_79433:599-916(-)